MPKSLQNPHLSNVNSPPASFKEQLKTENYVNTELKKSLKLEDDGHFCLTLGGQEHWLHRLKADTYHIMPTNKVGLR